MPKANLDRAMQQGNPASDLIHVHHIGGRDGSMPYAAPRVFAKDVLFYNYEADADCIAQMDDAMDRGPFTSVSREALIGEGKGSATLHINHDPYTSSLLPTAKGLGDLYYHDADNGDYIAARTFATVEQRLIPTVSFDECIADRSETVDFLTLDVQGAESLILRAAPRALGTQVLGVICEVAFEAFYEGHGLFPDVFAITRSHGFRFIRLVPHGEWAWHRAPIGWRGVGATLQGDALFLKSPATVVATHPSPALALSKLAATALFYGCIEFMLECLQTIEAHSLQRPGGTRKYLRMLTEIAGAYSLVEKVFPPAFDHLFSTQESRARFLADARALEGDAPFARARRRYFQDEDPVRFFAQIEAAFGPEPLPLQAILLRYGLERTAAKVRSDAQALIRHSLQLLGLVSTRDSQSPIDLDALRRELVAPADR